MSDRDVALALEREIIGPLRKLMPCGCVMRVRSKIDVERSLPWHPVTYLQCGFPVYCCEEHAKNCSYIGQRFDE